MSSTTSADIAPFATGGQKEEVAIHEADVIESNHHLPARTMAQGGDRRDQKDVPAEDAATTAASEELKHTTISDKVLPVSKSSEESTAVESEATGEDKDMNETIKDITPEADSTGVQDEEMRERITSPKKKRGRDQDEDAKDLEESSAEAPGSADGSAPNGSSRTMRDGPEKKRPRDTSEDYTNAAGEEEIKVAVLFLSCTVSFIFANFCAGHFSYRF